MRLVAWLVRVGLLALLTGTVASAQTPDISGRPKRDVLIMVDGEKFLGQLKSVDGDWVSFQSDLAGDLRVNRNEVQELRTVGPSAIAPQGTSPNGHTDLNKVPEQYLQGTDLQIAVASTSSAPSTIPVAQTMNVAPQSGAGKATAENAGFLQGWSGTATGSLGLTESLARSLSYSAAVNLTRSTPPRHLAATNSLMSINFLTIFGTTSQPGFATSRTTFYEGDVEQDKFFSPRFIGIALAGIDHNYSQGLQQEDTIGGGVGFIVIRNMSSELNLRATPSYIRQDLYNTDENRSLVGTAFAEAYKQKLTTGLLFDEHVTITPTWNDPTKYFLTGGAKLTLPVSKRLSSTLSSEETYLNDAPIGYRKNFFQLSAGLSFSIR
jgi:Protein of unknown function, DUF481